VSLGTVWVVKALNQHHRSIFIDMCPPSLSHCSSCISTRTSLKRAVEACMLQRHK
jgi:hypothetical protein